MTDIQIYLQSLVGILEERINGTRSEPKWHQHWQRELRAVQRALWALGEQA